ncbi:MAG: DUF433 domain-containing protein [Candidatus Binataceae bacterium]
MAATKTVIFTADGVPCIRGLPIPIATVVRMMADRMIHDEILQAYPDLEAQGH